jgi:hypothetical protein
VTESPLMSHGPVLPRSNPDPTDVRWHQWVRWALFIASITMIGMIALFGTSAKNPWITALF